MDSLIIEKEGPGKKDFDELIRSTIEMASPVHSPDIDSSDDDEAPTQRIKKRIRQFSDSDSDINKENQNNDTVESDSGSDNEISKSIPLKSRTRITLQNNSDSDLEGLQVIKNEGQQTRMKNKHNKIKEKFRSLLNSRKNEEEAQKNYNSPVKDIDSNLAGSDEDISSIETIKQIIKERTSFMPSLCDPDTSDEEESQPKRKMPQKKERKSTKATSPKPIRMSAKQAMENMHKIKSESNRMLREKEVSLPYHRPKALSLKDIMSRRKPALNAEGKALPVKMNETQLKEYALLLEQRQKEMIELCKSDTDEDNDNEASSLNTKDLIIDNKIKEPVEDTFSKTDNAIGIDNHILVKEQPIIETVENPSLLKNVKHTDEVNTDVNNADIQNSEMTVHVESNDEEGAAKKYLVDNDSDPNAIDCYAKRRNSEDNNVQMSVDEVNETKDALEDTAHNAVADSLQQSKSKLKSESQLLHLHYDSEPMKDSETFEEANKPSISMHMQGSDEIDEDDIKKIPENQVNDFTFSDDDDLDMDDIDKLIENAEIVKETQDNINSLQLVKDPQPLRVRPILMGAPGTVIDLDETDSIATKKLTGVELLKERFSYFARVKTPEELEREKEKKLKPGSLHLRLKQQLENQIAEQRSLEWAKRLEDEKQQQLDMTALRGEEIDEEDDIEKIEAKLEEKDISKEVEEDSSSSEEEIIEDDVVVKDKPRVKNAMVDDEAEESDCDEDDSNVERVEKYGDNSEEGDDNEESEDDESDNESSEDEETTTTKKGRILKAFEDSDDEDVSKVVHGDENNLKKTDNANEELIHVSNFVESETYTQDDEIQLAQNHKSDDLFASQESGKALNNSMESNEKDDSLNEDKKLGIFSIANRKFNGDPVLEGCVNNTGITDTQPFIDDNFLPIPEMTLGALTQSILPSQLSTQQSQSQPIGEDILALCTGKFYDNEFITPPEQTITQETTDCESQELSLLTFNDVNETNVSMNKLDTSLHANKQTETIKSTDEINDIETLDNANILDQDNTENVFRNVIENTRNSCQKDNNSKTETNRSTEKDKPNAEDPNILKSILDELNDPEFDSLKPNKYFTGNSNVDSVNTLKKKFVIESDEEVIEDNEATKRKKKKLKKKKSEKRALQISDDEEEIDDVDDDEQECSDLEEDNERVVEYDSEENEVEVNVEKPKKKRKVGDFFEQEAELTSEDEWVGSGDEDEADLDRMEREEGDDDHFNQRQLQQELGQIHMRDVLDQDKREVRIIQELLFEDGDLGAGSRQRKFRWKNADGEEETGVINDDITDTQEEEFESEEQWRKQRHEREVFLRQMKNEDDIAANISINRTSIIKANLNAKSMSSVLSEASTIDIEKPVPIEKKNSKDIPSPKKPFAIFQQSYHGSLLTRGRGALARLAALVTPLAVDDDAPKIGSLGPSRKRNFVFASLTQEEPKVTKRKAENVDSTPKLVKKMKLEEKQKRYKSSLLEHMKI